MKYSYNDWILSSIETLRSLDRDNISCSVNLLFDDILSTLHSNSKILIFGNGGSAAMSSHFAAELSVRYRLDRKPFPAISITDCAALTATANDYFYDYIFQRQIEALARNSDIVIGMSTSGKSNNVINAIKTAVDIGCRTYLMTGSQYDANIDDVNLIQVNSSITASIQEIHLSVIHCLCDNLDYYLSVNHV
tara:strand:+ start:5739 stop:6314 length:576 start_codon:yes stop_codon:yes gene_type:complete